MGLPPNDDENELDDLSGMGNANSPPPNDSVDMGRYDKMEREAREEIQTMFEFAIEKIEAVQLDFQQLIEAKPELVSGKYRISLTKKQLDDLTTMVNLNQLIAETKIYLKTYIDMGAEVTPPFENIKNLIYRFQYAFMKEQNRRFAVIRFRSDKFYITKGLVDYYLKAIHIMLSRITGSLRPASNYIVIVPPTPHPQPGMGMGGLGGGGYPGGGGYESGGGYSGGDDYYANANPWWQRGSQTAYLKQGSRVTPGKRGEFGDAETR